MTTRKRPPGVRKLPAQPRSTARMGRILNSCAALIDEVGYDAVTTTRIAEHAHVAVGSIYQYFTNKHGVTAALAARHLTVLLDNTTAAFDPALGATPAAAPGDVITAFCDEAIDSFRNEPGCRTLRFGTGLIQLEGPHPHDTITDHLLGLMPPSATNDRRALQLAVECAVALITVAFRNNHDGDQQVLDAAREASVTVLNDYLP